MKKYFLDELEGSKFVFDLDKHSLKLKLKNTLTSKNFQREKIKFFGFF